MAAAKTHVVGDAQRRMVRPSQVVGQTLSMTNPRAVRRVRVWRTGSRSSSRRCCRRRGPAAPPGVRSLDVSAQGTHPHPRIPTPPAICPRKARSSGRKPACFSLAFAFLMSSGVRDVEIAAQYRLLAADAASSRSCPIRTSMVSRKRYFCFIFSGSSVLPACTYAYDSDGVPLRVFIRFDPTAGIDVLLKSRQSVALVDDGQRGEQTDAGASLIRQISFMRSSPLWSAMRPAVAYSKPNSSKMGSISFCQGAYFLHAPHVRRVLRGPLLDAFAFRRADSIHIRCRDCDRHSALA